MIKTTLCTIVLCLFGYTLGGGSDPIPVNREVQHYMVKMRHRSSNIDTCYDGVWDLDGPSGDHGTIYGGARREGPLKDVTPYLEGDWTVKWQLSTSIWEGAPPGSWLAYDFGYSSLYPNTGCPFWLTSSHSSNPWPQFTELQPNAVLYMEFIDGNGVQHQEWIPLDPPGPAPHYHYNWTFTTEQFPSGVSFMRTELYLVEGRRYGYEWYDWDDDCDNNTPRTCSPAEPRIEFWYWKHFTLIIDELQPPS